MANAVIGTKTKSFTSLWYDFQGVDIEFRSYQPNTIKCDAKDV